jgi:hypothetical protein
MDVDRPGAHRVLDLPHHREQLLARVDAARLGGQRGQQFELERGERQQLARQLDLVAAEVDLEIAQGDFLRAASRARYSDFTAT